MKEAADWGSVPLATIDRRLLDVASNSLWRFVQLAFNVVEPSVMYRDGRHIQILCEYLQAVSYGEIKRLLVNIPPGCMKSLTLCVFWPTWDWVMRNLGRKWLFASYDASLTRRDAQRSLDLIQSQWFREVFPQPVLRDEKPAVGDIYTVKQGFRFATSVRGKATGRHVDIQVVDDPIKPKDADGGARLSQAILDECINWWEGTMSTRVTDPKKTARVIIMQRLHERDLAGHVRRQGGYECLVWPMRFEKKHAVPSDWRSTDGELLWPERFDAEAVEILEGDLGAPEKIAAQLQQRPAPVGGLIFNRDQIRFWHEREGVEDPYGRLNPKTGEVAHCKVRPDRGGVYCQSWDMTFKDGDGTDNVSGQVWYSKAPDFYLIANDTRRMSFTDSLDAVRVMSRSYPRTLAKYIENKANGPAVENVLKKELSGIRLVEPNGGKVARANAVQPLFLSGNVYVPHPELAPWVEGYIKELCDFPNGMHDDQVDATTQALTQLTYGQTKLRKAMQNV